MGSQRFAKRDLDPLRKWGYIQDMNDILSEFKKTKDIVEVFWKVVTPLCDQGFKPHDIYFLPES